MKKRDNLQYGLSTMARDDEFFMAKAIDLARKGRGSVEPNPMVGAVIVKEGKIIGQGYHERFGGPHAEINAINDALNHHEDLTGATMYVTLEPCCHFGKTPPCTEAIISSGISRVVSAIEDVDPKVAGRGFKRLRDAGVEVVVGTRAEEVRKLLSGYIKLKTKQQPWVICKWAQSVDGKIATVSGDSKWISSAASRRRVHELRRLCDGVCVGVGTVIADDPLLTSRDADDNPSPSQPVRVILDSRLRIPLDCRLVRTLEVSPVIIATTNQAAADRLKLFQQAGIEVLSFPSHEGKVDLQSLLTELGKREWTYLLIEGGRGVITSFITQGLVDELMVFIAPCIIGGEGSISAVHGKDIERITQVLKLPCPEVEQIDSDVLLRYIISQY